MNLSNEKRLPLHALHAQAGAKWAPFAGFMMPLHHRTKPLEEHHLVRHEVGVFDITHMGQFVVRGKGSAAFLNYAVTNDVLGMTEGQALYSPLCQENGGVLDDLIVYRISQHEHRVIVNAARRSVDLAQLQSVAKGRDVSIEDRSDALCLFAVQGPKAFERLRGVCAFAPEHLGYYTFTETTMFGKPVFLARTGYTGEPGCEISVTRQDAQAIWCGLTQELQVAPIGLAARDSLRLEAAMALYGHELREDWHPLECGLGWAVKVNTADICVGAAAILAQKQTKTYDLHVGLQVQGRGIVRENVPLLFDGQVVGQTTSGGYSPTLEKAIALGKVRRHLAKAGQRLQVNVRGRLLEVDVVKRPFYQNPDTRG